MLRSDPVSGVARPHLRCFHGCEGTLDITSGAVECPTCGGLLDVSVDVAGLKRASLTERRALLTARSMWDRRDWVLPGLPVQATVSLGEGNSPLVRAPHAQRTWGHEQLWVHQCGQSPTGSFKDLGMTVLVSAARWGAVEGKPQRPLACASTGDTSAALAAYAAAAGMRAVILLPKGKVSPAQLVQPLAAGALVLSLDTDFDGCMKLMARLAQDGLVHLANSKNPLRLEGQKTVAFDIVAQLGKAPEWVVLPSGNLGNAYAIYKGFHLLAELELIAKVPRIVCAQAERANPLYRAWHAGDATVQPVEAQGTLATAIQIGAPVSAPRALKALRETNGLVEQATEAELLIASAHADRTGLYVCPQTAVALACAKKLADRSVFDEADRVVVVATAHGLKFTEQKLQLHAGKLDSTAVGLANPPNDVAADYDAVRAAILQA